MVAALEPVLGEAAGQSERFIGEALPGPRLPDAQILLADGRARAPHLRVMQQEFWKRVERGGLHSR